MRQYYLYILSYVLLLSFVSCSENGMVDDDTWKPSLVARYLNLESSNLTLDASGKSVGINVNSMSTPWQFTGKESWLSVTPAEGSQSSKVEIGAEENLSGQNIRTNVLTFSSMVSDYDYKKYLSVTQSAATARLELTGTNVSVTANGGTVAIGVESNIDYTLSVPADAKSWLTVEKKNDSQTILITIANNPTTVQRRSLVAVDGVVSKSITIVQEGAGMSSSISASLSVKQSGGEYSGQIKSEAPWDAWATESWINITPALGDAGVSNVQISVTPNNSTTKRTGSVRFRIGTNIVHTISVEQEEMKFSTGSSTLTFPADGGNKTLTVSSNTAWKILSSMPSWISASVTEGSGNATLTFTASEYNELTERTSTAKIGVEGITGLQKKITFKQTPRSITPIDELRFTASPGSKTLGISTDASWTLSSANDWITLSKTSGKGTIDAVVTVMENETYEERNGVIDITIGTTTKQIVVVQAGHYFDISPTAALPSTGGTQTLKISTDESWTARCDVPWLSLSAESGTGDIDLVITAVDNPSIKERRGNITILPKHATIIVGIFQNPRYLTVDNSLVTFYSKGGESTPISVSTDGTFVVNSSAEWLTISRVGNVITLIATKNDTDSERNAIVKVSMTGLNEGEEYSVEIPVRQRESSVINKGNFSDDQDWNIDGDTQFGIKITGFGEDENWNF